jgi:hypothetical protein
MELIHGNSNAFVLLYVIHTRVQRTSAFNRFGLKPGQAVLGDFKKCGMSEQNYRTAKAFLQKSGFATFKPTPYGTIATLTGTRVFDSNIEAANGQVNSQPTDGSRTGHGRVTTTNNEKNEEESEELVEDPVRLFKASVPDAEVRADWHGLDMEHKLFGVLGCSEMESWGPRWRKRARQQPDRIARVLDQIHSELAEGKIVKSRGAYAEDLWKRFR